MFRIGIVDLDTSHPGSFIPLIREAGAEVSVVFDSGTIYPGGYAEWFARKHKVGHAAQSLQEVARHADAVFICGCNWDEHIPKAEFFIKHGMPVFIDKPLCGNMKDLNSFLDWAEAGHRVTTGSALRYAAAAWAVEQCLQRPVSVHGFFPVDEFNYGIHCVEAAAALLPTGARWVRFISRKDSAGQYAASFDDGSAAFYTMGLGSHDFRLVAAPADEAPVSWSPESGTLYSHLIDAIVPFLAGKAEAPADPHSLADSIRILLAAKQSRINQRSIWLEDLRLDDRGFDGKGFSVEYRRGKHAAIQSFLEETRRSG